MAVYDINGLSTDKVYGKSGNLLSTVYDVSGKPIMQEAPTLRVMSYNLGTWYDGSGVNVPANQDAEYYALQTGMFARNNADVACFQEYMTQFSKLPRTADSVLEPYFPYRNCRQSGTYYGRGICSKYELTGYTVNTYTDNTNRYYDKAYITVGGRQIAVFTTHFDPHSYDNRLSEVAQLIPALKNEQYFICCGDYNTVQIYNGATTETDDYQNVVTPFLNEGFHSANWSDFGFLITIEGTNPGDWDGCLDSIITSSNIEIFDVYVDTTKLTDGITDKVDHMPIIADLIIH